MTLIVTVPEVARRLGIPQPPDEDDRWLIEQAITDAQSDMEAYLGRPVTPQAFTDHEVPLVEWRLLANQPVISVTTITPETDPGGGTTGFYTVDYVAGLDAATDPELEPIRRFVRTHAFYSAEVQALFRRIAPERARTVDLVAVEGQQVRYTRTFATTDVPGSGAPGTLPTLASCDRWRVAGRQVFQRRTPLSGRDRWRDEWYDTGWPYGWYGW